MIKGNLYIENRWEAAAAGGVRRIENPADGQIIAEVAEGDRLDAQRAIAAARRAFDSGTWSLLPAADRAAALRELASQVEKQREELARLETLDTGKTIEESRWDMDDVAAIFRFFADLAEQPAQEEIPSPLPETRSRMVREPVGVCGLIMPWNYPLLQAAWKVAPALVSGCTLVMKPSEITPLTTLELTRLAERVGFPPGVFNTVLGPGPSVGAELAENHAVDLISFTGGIRTGQEIMRAASGNVKKVALELGGKNPHILFQDADLEKALEAVLNGVFFHAGQICSAGARLLLHDSIHDRVVERLLPRVQKIRLGNGMDPECQMGPLISSAHRDKVQACVRQALEEGAHCLCGGAVPQEPAFQNGYYYQPTLLTGCKNPMRVIQEEVFGPVLTVERFQTEEEAVDRANSTVYGLSAGFWTRDEERIARISRALRFGTVWINDFNVYFAEAPWGGYKQSGLGRELGRPGLEEYTEVKHVFRNLNPRPLRWFGTS